MSDISIIFLAIAITFIFYKAFTFKSKTDIDEEKRLKESLADEYIYDPETGAKLTLEQAESGHWLEHSNLNRIKDTHEIEKFYFGKEKEAQELRNHIIENGFTFNKLTDSQLELLEKSAILSKYDNWSYSHSFSNQSGNCYVIFPAVEIVGNKHQNGYHETQILFWLKDENLSGHFYLREKTAFESLTDKFKNDDEIKMDRYESFTIRKSNNILYVIKLLELFQMEEGLELEILDQNLLIKTLRFPNMEDYLRIERLVKNVC